MSIKNNALLVSLSVSKPTLTQKDHKATDDAEAANNAHGAGHYRKNLYPKHLIQPIMTIESSARAFIEANTYMWNRGEYLLPTTKFMEFTQNIGTYELQFSQAVTAFLNNWSNVMLQAQQTQGDMFDPTAYPDTSTLKDDFRFKVVYRPVTDATDFRVQMESEEIDALREQVERETKESMDNLLKAPLRRLQAVMEKLKEVTGKADREVVNKKTGALEMKPPLFRDSAVDNITYEIDLLRAFVDVLPDSIQKLATSVSDTVPHPQQLRDDPVKRQEVHVQSAALLDLINGMLDD